MHCHGQKIATWKEYMKKRDTKEDEGIKMKYENENENHENLHWKRHKFLWQVKEEIQACEMP